MARGVEMQLSRVFAEVALHQVGCSGLSFPESGRTIFAYAALNRIASVAK